MKWLLEIYSKIASFQPNWNFNDLPIKITNTPTKQTGILESD